MAGSFEVVRPCVCSYKGGALVDGSNIGKIGLSALCAIDTHGYDSKPTRKEIGKINNRLSQEDSVCDIDLCDLAAKLSKGHTALFGICKGKRCKENVEAQQLFAIDIDNDLAVTERGFKPLAFTDAIDRAVYNRLPLALSYPSFSSSPDPSAPASEQRYRLVFMVEAPITGRQTAERYAHALYSVYPEADSSTTELERMFYGTDKTVSVWATASTE